MCAYSLLVRIDSFIDWYPICDRHCYSPYRPTTPQKGSCRIMASIRLDPLEQFDFKQLDNWSAWKKRLDQYRIASGLSEGGEPRQVCVLLYCLGPGIKGVLASTGVTEEDQKKYGTVCEKLDTFFSVQQNVIFEWVRFNLRNQLPGESAKEYISSLYILAESCKYGTFKQEMIRDRLVVGIRDRHLSERLQMDADLTFESVMKVICQKEATREQQHMLGSGTKGDLIVVDEVNRRQNSGAVRSSLWFPKRKQKSLTLHPPVPKQEELYCTRCRKAPAYPLKNCPVRKPNASDARRKDISANSAERKKLRVWRLRRKNYSQPTWTHSLWTSYKHGLLMLLWDWQLFDSRLIPALRWMPYGAVL